MHVKRWDLVVAGRNHALLKTNIPAESRRHVKGTKPELPGDLKMTALKSLLLVDLHNQLVVNKRRLNTNEAQLEDLDCIADSRVRAKIREVQIRPGTLRQGGNDDMDVERVSTVPDREIVRWNAGRRSCPLTVEEQMSWQRKISLWWTHRLVRQRGGHSKWQGQRQRKWKEHIFSQRSYIQRRGRKWFPSV